MNLVAFGGNNTQGEIEVATACNAHGETGRHDFESETFVCGPLQAHAAEHGHAMTTQRAVESDHVIAHTLRAEGFDASEDGTGRGVPLVPVAFNACESQSSGECIDIAPTLRSGSGRGGATMPAIAFTELGEGHVTYQETETAGSLRTPDGGGSELANVIAFDPRQVTSKDNRSNPQPGDPCPTMHEQPAAIAFQRKYFGNQPEQGGKPSEVSPTLTSAQAERSDGEITVAYRTSGNCGVMEQGDKTAALTTATDPNANIIYQQHGSNVGPMGTLRRGNGDVQSGVPFMPDVAYCLSDARGTGDGHGQGWNSNYVGTRMAVRRLMPKECCRLMGWPDDHNECGIDENGNRVEMSDSVRYRQCGNGVVATVAEWIGRRILEIDPCRTASSAPSASEKRGSD